MNREPSGGPCVGGFTLRIRSVILCNGIIAIRAIAHRLSWEKINAAWVNSACRADTPTGVFDFQPQAKAGYHSAINAAILGSIAFVLVRTREECSQKSLLHRARGRACPISSGTKVTTVLWRFIESDGNGPSLGIELAREGRLDAFQGFAIRHPGVGHGLDLHEAVSRSLQDAVLARSVF